MSRSFVRFCLPLVLALTCLSEAPAQVLSDFTNVNPISDGFVVQDSVLERPIDATELRRSARYGIHRPVVAIAREDGKAPRTRQLAPGTFLIAVDGRRVFAAYEAESIRRELIAAGEKKEVELVFAADGIVYVTREPLLVLSELTRLPDCLSYFEIRRLAPELVAYAMRSSVVDLGQIETLPPRAAFEIDAWLAQQETRPSAIDWLDGFLELFANLTESRHADCKAPPEAPLPFVKKLTALYLPIASSASPPGSIDDFPTEHESLVEFLALYPHPTSPRFPLGDLELSDLAFHRALNIACDPKRASELAFDVAEAFLKRAPQDSSTEAFIGKVKASLLDTRLFEGRINPLVGRLPEDLPALATELRSTLDDAALTSGDRMTSIAGLCAVLARTGESEALAEFLEELQSVSPWFAWRTFDNCKRQFERDANPACALVLDDFAKRYYEPGANAMTTLLNRHVFFLGHRVRRSSEEVHIPAVLTPRPEHQIYSLKHGTALNAGWVAMHSPHFAADMITSERRPRQRAASAGVKADWTERIQELRIAVRNSRRAPVEDRSMQQLELLYELNALRHHLPDLVGIPGFDVIYLNQEFLDPTLLDFRPDLALPLAEAASQSLFTVPNRFLPALFDPQGSTPEELAEKFRLLEEIAGRGSDRWLPELAPFARALVRASPELGERASIILDQK